MKVTFTQYSTLKQTFRLKEYVFLVGFFLNLFGHAVAIRDEKSKIHYVRKSSLIALRAQYDFPNLNQTILLEQIRMRKEAVILWNLPEVEKCGISDSQRQKLEVVVKPLMVEGVVDQLFKKGTNQLPLTLFIANGRFFLKLSEKNAGIAGRGGQRLIKFAYDLTKGRRVVRKEIATQELEAMSCFCGIRGIAKIEAIFKDKILLEKYYAGSLKNLLHSRIWLNVAEVLQVAKDLLGTLSEMHQRTTLDGSPAFHSDIKLDNLFYRPSKKRGIEVVIGDLGFANGKDRICGTSNWFSPEYAKERLEREWEKKFDPQLNRKHGQALDLWAVGLVIASFLIQDGKPRLECLRFAGGWSKTLPEILKVDQLKIDQEIAKRQLQEPNARLKALWKIVQGLVRVDPFERISSKDALKMIES